MLIWRHLRCLLYTMGQGRGQNRQYCLALGILACSVPLFMFAWIYKSGTAFLTPSPGPRNFAKLHESRPTLGPLRLDAVRSEKWIVVTTIAPPTPDLRFLASIPGWRVVVVGDSKTPSTWQLPNCVYLSLQRQRDLGLETVELLPERSYARKNAGYLYAIAHGARVIYETDDDNRPLDRLRNFLLAPTTSGLMYVGGNLFNPYRHFGQATLWPRGYPLSAVGESANSSYLLGRWSTPGIQQGLVNGDPDMDAIFRLTRKKTTEMLNTTFDASAPPAILPRGVFSPFNSQNTLFRQEALWATLIPITTTFRICDIWRGYWAQRLLWEVGGTLAFLPPNAFQRRNAHSYMADAVDERDMYFRTEDLLRFLQRWRCAPSLSFFDCLQSLSLDMAVAGFWGADDANLAKAWVSDLKRANYSEPKRLCMPAQASPQAAADASVASRKRNDVRGDLSTNRDAPDAASRRCDVTGNLVTAAVNGSVTSVSADGRPMGKVLFWAMDQEPPMTYTPWKMDRALWKHVQGVKKICRNESLALTSKLDSAPENRLSDVLLIVVFSFPHYGNVPFLQAMYGYHFPRILYCGNDTDTFANASKSWDISVSFVEAPLKKGYQLYMCLVRAMRMNYKVTGYLLIGDDTLINAWILKDFDRSKFWFPVLHPARRSESIKWYWWGQKGGSQALGEAFEDLSRSTTTHSHRNQSIAHFTRLLQRNYFFVTKTTADDGAFRGCSDFVYVPRRFKQDAVFFLETMAAHDVFLEIAVPTVIAGLSPIEQIVRPRGDYLWLGQRSHPQKFYHRSKAFLHPMKLSFLKSHPDVWSKFFCQKYLAAML